MQQTLNQGDILHLLCFSAYAGQSVEPIIEDVRKILSAQNEIAPNDPQAIQFVNIAKQFETFNMLFIGIDFLVWLVGMGTLLAGVIGISNIMMVTVKERTKEIGVRRALGAKPYNIISQVMSESLALTAMAGLLGLSFGVFILDIINKAMSTQEVTRETFFINPGVDIDTAVYASIVLLISGMVAGLIPAWRAMQIKAIDAIREE
jgi:putative ABC transport system permease protein